MPSREFSKKSILTIEIVNPLVTVLLPVYNGEKYLHDAIQSIQGQLFKDYEFLIIDDGSTDGSLKIINSFKDPRIKVLRNKERLKLSGVLNFGIREAKGEYIARIDADDFSFLLFINEYLGMPTRIKFESRIV